MARRSRSTTRPWRSAASMRHERFPHAFEITGPEPGSRSAREVHRRIREVELGRPAKAHRGLAIPTDGERGGSLARQQVGLLLAVLAIEHQALVLGEQVVDRRASRGQDLLATAQDGWHGPPEPDARRWARPSRPGPSPTRRGQRRSRRRWRVRWRSCSGTRTCGPCRTPRCCARRNPSDRGRATKRRGSAGRGRRSAAGPASRQA